MYTKEIYKYQNIKGYKDFILAKIPYRDWLRFFNKEKG